MSYYPDSVPIGIDTLSTYCMTNDLADFCGTPKDCTCKVLGVNNTTELISKISIGSYTILDQSGMRHTWVIPELYYCLTTPYRVISPQHLVHYAASTGGVRPNGEKNNLKEDKRNIIFI
jgi:hypothetical protein